MSHKTYLIIGGNQGIGNACLLKLIDQGHQVITITRTECKKVNQQHIVINQDVCDSFPQLNTYTDSLDGLIYCPGSINLKPFTRLDKNDFIQDFDKNVLGLVSSVQHSLPLLKQSTSASVVAFSTIASTLGMSYHASVATCKSAIEGLMKSLAAEYAMQKIRFNVIAPSIVDTPLASSILTNEDKKKEIANKHPLKTIGNAENIADIAVMLLGNSATWITGQVIHADGGLSSISKI